MGLRHFQAQIEMALRVVPSYPLAEVCDVASFSIELGV
jgi:hypothetical protein